MATAAAATLYRRYLQAPDHPSKLRIVRMIERKLFNGAEGLEFSVGDKRLLLHPQDAIEYDFLCGKPYEPATTEFLRRDVKDGHVAVFCGSNTGYFPITAAPLVGAAGKVVAIEPQLARTKHGRNSKRGRIGGLGMTALAREQPIN